MRWRFHTQGLTTAIAGHSLVADLFLRPLDVIAAEHNRQLVLYEQLASRENTLRLEFTLGKAEALLSYLTVDLPLHFADEESDLFRLLKRRCGPEHGIDGILSQLNHEHALDMFMALDLTIDLRTVTNRRTLESPMRLFKNLRTFTEVQLRHMAWENATVLPLARKRLKPEDLEEMGHNMAARRTSIRGGSAARPRFC